MTVEVVDFRAKLAKRIRRFLFAALRKQIGEMGDDLAGYALITWDHRGMPNTSILTGEGPIGSAMLPCYVRDVLNQHITAEIAQNVQVTTSPDEPA